jgi:hypothetical protein
MNLRPKAVTPNDYIFKDTMFWDSWIHAVRNQSLYTTRTENDGTEVKTFKGKEKKRKNG